MEIILTNKETKECYMALQYLSMAVSTQAFIKVIDAKRALKTKAIEASEYYQEVGKKLESIDANGNVAITDPIVTAKFNALTAEFSTIPNTFEITPIEIASLEGEKLIPANVELLMDAGIIV